MQPVTVYINWTAYDELADDIELTEDLAMRQFDELLRLRSKGVRLDCYLMDAFWYDPDGGYRTWRKPHWPEGPDRWLAACRQHDVLPGLWVSTNSLCGLNPYAAWEDSLNRDRTAMCMFDGGFLTDFMNMLQHWYERGIRVFKFDFARFDAATKNAEHLHLPHHIPELNGAALRTALSRFRRQHPDAYLLAYNGFGGIQDNTSKPFRKTVDARLLEVFDSLYCGDPCPADVPMMNFWRAQDTFSDHMVWQYQRNGIPLERIDNSAFMIGDTHACYRRKTSAWKGMLILSLARGGLINTYYGNLEFLDDRRAAWFAGAQSMFLELRRRGRFCSFGGIPGEAQAYGYAALSDRGALYTVVNPAQEAREVDLGSALPARNPTEHGRVLFRDAGFEPRLAAGSITLGPEQMCVVGYGSYSEGCCDLGTQEDVLIPAAIEPIPARFETAGHNTIATTVTPPRGGDLRIVMRQSHNGTAFRSTGGGPPDGRPLSEILRVSARQAGADVPVRTQHDKVIWSGLSWVVGEIGAGELHPGQPVDVTCSSAEEKELRIDGSVYRVAYGSAAGM